MGIPNAKTFDLAIVGGGILGTTLAYWLSLLYEGKNIVVLEKESQVGLHTSSRNTGVIHRPFYLNPKTKEIFARSALLSYRLWEKYAKIKNLPWRMVGTVEVATEESQLKTLEKYQSWARENGMKKNEVELLNRAGVKKLEPNIRCHGALFCKTDAATDFGVLTQNLQEDAQENGVKFLLNSEVKKIRQSDQELTLTCQNGTDIKSHYFLNCAGGNAVKIAHLMGVAHGFTDLNFRGEYWLVDPAHADLAKHNIYSVPRRQEFPFLDPHWVVRWDEQVEIGPNAVLVAGPYNYRGLFHSPREVFKKLFEKPRKNKLKLLANPEFLQLALAEWKSSFSKKIMVERLQKFLPKVHTKHLVKPGAAGIRSSVVDNKGQFVKEALEFFGPLSFHVLNFNSPGATGAPAYAAYLIEKLRKKRRLEHLKEESKKSQCLWDYKKVIQLF